MKACITGIAGFVGPFLKKELEDNGYTVIGFDKDTVDITDADAVKSYFEKEKPDVVFHLAGFSSVAKSFEQPELCRKINVDGTRNLLDACSANGVRRVLVVSSSDVYGKPQYLPIDEKHPVVGISPYAKSRIEQEKIANEYDIEVVFTRSFNHTGPSQPDIFVCSDFAHQIVNIEKGEQQEIRVGNIDVTRDFSDVRDIVYAYRILMEKGADKEVYNVGSGKEYKIRDVLEMLKGFSSADISVVEDSAKFREAEIPRLWCNNSKIRSLGVEFRHDIKDTLKDMLEWWREN